MVKYTGKGLLRVVVYPRTDEHLEGNVRHCKLIDSKDRHRALLQDHDPRRKRHVEALIRFPVKNPREEIAVPKLTSLENVLPEHPL